MKSGFCATVVVMVTDEGRQPDRLERADSGTVLRPKPYVSIDELAALTPWTDQAIRSKIKRGDFLEDVHYFRLGRRIVFKWSAVENLIEHRRSQAVNPIPLQRSRRYESSEE